MNLHYSQLFLTANHRVNIQADQHVITALVSKSPSNHRVSIEVDQHVIKPMPASLLLLLFHKWLIIPRVAMPKNQCSHRQLQIKKHMLVPQNSQLQTTMSANAYFQIS